MKKRSSFKKILKTAIVVALLAFAIGQKLKEAISETGVPYTPFLPFQTQAPAVSYDAYSLPAWDGEHAWYMLDSGPQFDTDSLPEGCFEEYGDKDPLGRCTAAFCRLGADTMPTEDRGEISSVKPTGWVQAKYDCVDGGWLYNRCHLVAYCLSAENANANNLVTGTRYMNTEGMLPWELTVLAYLQETDDTVLYRSTPVFEGENLLCSGVILEALSAEDGGLSFAVWCPNVQPGVTIDYASGKSWLEGGADR